MKNIISKSFKVKNFVGGSSHEFSEVLKVYNSEIAANLKTSINEIQYFASNPDIQKNRKMFFLGLYYDDNIIGYCQAGYIKGIATIIIDYFVIKKDYLKNGIFYPLFNLVLQYFTDQIVEYNYIVIEAAQNMIGKSVDQRLFFLEGFGMVDALYRQPYLGIQNKESNFDFQLMLYTSSPVTSIKKETYLQIVEGIYFQHYLDWYKHFMSEHDLEEYSEHLKAQYNIIEEKLENVLKINVLSENKFICEFYQSDECHYHSTAGYVSSPVNISKTSKRITISVIVFIALLLANGILYYILRRLNISISNYAAIFTNMMAYVVGILTFHKKR